MLVDVGCITAGVVMNGDGGVVVLMVMIMISWASITCSVDW